MGQYSFMLVKSEGDSMLFSILLRYFICFAKLVTLELNM
jgi:hypothetical protein